MTDKSAPDQQLLTMRIVHGGLCTGLLAMTLILGGLRLTNNQPPAPMPIIGYVALGFAVVALLLSFLVPGVMASGWRRQVAAGKWPFSNAAESSDAMAWWPMYQIRLIVGMAILEGAAFFQVIAYFIEGLPLNLGAALGLLVVMLTRFPTRAGIDNWVTAQHEQVEMLKQDRS